MIRSQYRALGALLATALVNLGGLALGWWWVTVLTALAVAALVRGAAMVAAVVAGTLLAWGAALLWQSGGRTVDVANFVGAMAFNGRGLGWVVLIVTFAYAVLLALAGAWLGAAGRRVVVEFRANKAKAPEPVESVLAEQEDRIEEEEHV